MGTPRLDLSKVVMGDLNAGDKNGVNGAPAVSASDNFTRPRASSAVPSRVHGSQASRARRDSDPSILISPVARSKVLQDALQKAEENLKEKTRAYEAAVARAKLQQNPLLLMMDARKVEEAELAVVKAAKEREAAKVRIDDNSNITDVRLRAHSESLKRYHPLLQTTAEVGSSLCADSLPVMAKIRDGVELVTWNVKAHGYSMIQAKSQQEKDLLIREAGNEIVDALKRIMHLQAPAFILLQDPDFQLDGSLKAGVWDASLAHFGYTRAIVRSGKDKREGGNPASKLITFYNHKLIAQCGVPEGIPPSAAPSAPTTPRLAMSASQDAANPPSSPRSHLTSSALMKANMAARQPSQHRDIVQRCFFTLLLDDTPITLLNVLLPREEFPIGSNRFISEQLKTYQNLGGEADITVIAGDFNNFYVHSQALANTSVVTRVIPPSERYGTTKIQGCDSTQGAYFADNEGRCREPLAIQVLSPLTGQIYETSPLDRVSLEDYSSDEQQVELCMQRPVLSCAIDWWTSIDIGMKQYMDSKGLLVDWSASALNDRRIFLRWGVAADNEDLIVNVMRAFPEGMDGVDLKIGYDDEKSREKKKRGTQLFLTLDKLELLKQVVVNHRIMNAYNLIFPAILAVTQGVFSANVVLPSFVGKSLQECIDELRDHKDMRVREALHLAEYFYVNPTEDNAQLVWAIDQVVTKYDNDSSVIGFFKSASLLFNRAYTEGQSDEVQAEMRASRNEKLMKVRSALSAGKVPPTIISGRNSPVGVASGRSSPVAGKGSLSLSVVVPPIGIRSSFG